MMNSNGMRGKLLMFSAMAAMAEAGMKEDGAFKEDPKKVLMRSDAALTKKQLKVRAKNKRAKSARKINR